MGTDATPTQQGARHPGVELAVPVESVPAPAGVSAVGAAVMGLPIVLPLPDLPLEITTCHAGGPCEVVQCSSKLLLTSGADGKLIATDLIPVPPARLWASRIAASNGALTAVATTSLAAADGGVIPSSWLAFGQEYESGFGVWVCPLDSKKGPDKTKMRLVARFTLPVRQLCWHRSLPLLGVATDDGKLLVWDREAARIRHCQTNRKDGGLRCLAFDPIGQLLAAAFSSGVLAIFNLEDGVQRYRNTIWPKGVIGGERLFMDWQPDGKRLALPGFVGGSCGGESVRLLNREDYALALSLKGGHRHTTTTVAWSYAGDLLATASCDAVALWRPPELVRICRMEAMPQSLAWAAVEEGKSSSGLAIGTADGAWAHIAVALEEWLSSAASMPAAASEQDVSGDPGDEGAASVVDAGDDLLHRADMVSGDISSPSCLVRTQELLPAVVQEVF